MQIFGREDSHEDWHFLKSSEIALLVHFGHLVWVQRWKSLLHLMKLGYILTMPGQLAPERSVTMANSKVTLWLPTWPELVMSRHSCWGRHHPGNQRSQTYFGSCFVTFSSASWTKTSFPALFRLMSGISLLSALAGQGRTTFSGQTLRLPPPTQEGLWPLWQQIHCTI